MAKLTVVTAKVATEMLMMEKCLRFSSIDLLVLKETQKNNFRNMSVTVITDPTDTLS